MTACTRVESFGEIGVGDLRAVEANAFVDPQQVWRRVEPGAQSGRAQNTREHRRRRAFAVRPGDVHGPKRAFGVAQPLANRADIVQVEFGGARLLRRGQFAAQGEQIADRLIVSHGAECGLSDQEISAFAM